MPQYIEVPPSRLPVETLQALMEEYVTRDGTDYGVQERTLEDKVASLSTQIQRGELRLMFEMESEQWDLVPEADVASLSS